MARVSTPDLSWLRVNDTLLPGSVLLPYVGAMFAFLQTALTDQERTEGIIKSAVGLLGDLAEAFPSGQIKPHLQTEWVTEAVKAARTRSRDAEGKAVAKWAKEVSDRMLALNRL